MGVTQCESYIFTALCGTVADAVDFELFCVALAYADYHVVDKCACQAVESSVELIVRRTGNMDHIAFHCNCYIRVKLFFECTFCAFNFNFVTVYGNSHICRYSYRSTTDSRHILLPPYHTNARTSPPTLSFLASLSVITPLDVETIAIPSPLRTLGRFSLPA